MYYMPKIFKNYHVLFHAQKGPHVLEENMKKCKKKKKRERKNKLFIQQVFIEHQLYDNRYANKLGFYSVLHVNVCKHIFCKI